MFQKTKTTIETDLKKNKLRTLVGIDYSLNLRNRRMMLNSFCLIHQMQRMQQKLLIRGVEKTDFKFRLGNI